VTSSEVTGSLVDSNVAENERVWKRAAGAKNGLMWVASASASVPGTTNWGTDTVLGTAPTGTTAHLADVVGSRKIKVTASADGKISVEKEFTFGKGPLSVFSKTGTTGVQWSPGYFKQGNGTPYFQDSDNTFPAAVNLCGGTVNNDVKVTGNANASSSGFEPNPGNNDWSEEYKPQGKSNMMRYAQTSKLAKTDQLLAVSLNSGKGAALAAGWSFSSYYNYVWTGDVFIGANNFMGLTVHISSGSSDQSNLNLNTAAVCLQ
jgi:hypothetical protein